MNYGLIGGKLGHSHSPQLHAALGTTDYQLLECTPATLDAFLKEKTFAGINVTIPYKETVLSYLDEIDPKAKEIGSVNTIIHEQGRLKGYNTDYHGIRYLLAKHEVLIKQQKVLILGSGGTSKTAQVVMQDLCAKEILVVSRDHKQGRDGITFLTYEEIQAGYDADVVINTTPIGMYPNSDAQVIDLLCFTCHTVIDVIYNPLQTALLYQAAQLGKKAVGGLEMLVAQAVHANALFQKKEHSVARIHELYVELYRSLVNIVFIGMPGSGKSSIALQVAQSVNKTMQDMDLLIEAEANQTIAQLFQQYGEAHFRSFEHELAVRLASKQNQVLSTGGGIVKNKENIRSLKQNGLLFFIDREVQQLELSDKRPLSQTREANLRLYEERYPLYLDASDAVITNNGSEEEAIKQIMEEYHEITSH